MNEVENKKLKPVIFVKGDYNYHRKNVFQQNLLLRALQVTTDPQKLKKMVGFRNVAEVYRTLDKIAIRREYHQALIDKGLDLVSIVGGIKNECENSDSSAIRLRGYQILLKSLGLDEYKETADEAKSGWEDTLKKELEKEESSDNKHKRDLYEVNVPVIPEEGKEMIEKEDEAGKDLYG